MEDHLPVRALVLMLSLAETLFLPAKADDAWKEFSSVPGNFAIRFPVPPKTTVRSGHVAYILVNQVVYKIEWRDMPRPKSGKSEDLDALLADFKTGFLEGIGKCATVLDSPASPPFHDSIGWHYICHADNNDGIDITRSTTVFLGKSHCYVLEVLWATQNGEPPGSARFVKSFRLLDPTK